MTTAARPTFEPARGRTEKDLSAMSKHYSTRDLAAHTKMKQREAGQGTAEELRGRDFRRELEDRERAAREKRGDGSGSGRRPRAEPLPAAALDADDAPDEDESDEESDDDEAELMAELQRIRKERAADAVRREAERKAEEERIRMENILSGNPLLAYSGAAGKADAKVKRRWDDDVVFKNCARNEPERKQARFINDALRNDFHKKFMDKYVK